MQEVAVWNNAQQPSVLRVASLVKDKPFPTLFWLIDQQLNYQIDQLEAQGHIAQLQSLIDHDPLAQAQMRLDHQRHINLRNHYMSPDIKQRLTLLGFYAILQKRGIGGIAKPTQVRCLHTYYAAHLVEPNFVGRWVDERLSEALL